MGRRARRPTAQQRPGRARGLRGGARGGRRAPLRHQGRAGGRTAVRGVVKPMAHTFNFRLRHSYDTTKVGITVPVELTNGPKVVQIDAKLDTGASFCIFERTYAEVLGLTVEGGTPA